MLIKPRRVRHSDKFSSRMRTGSRQRQEYAASVYAMAIVQAGLAVALIVAAIQAYNAVAAHKTDASITLKFVLPVVFVAGALLSLRASFRNIQAARAIWRERKRPRSEAPPDKDHPEP